MEWSGVEWGGEGGGRRTLAAEPVYLLGVGEREVRLDRVSDGDGGDLEGRLD